MMELVVVTGTATANMEGSSMQAWYLKHGTTLLDMYRAKKTKHAVQMARETLKAKDAFNNRKAFPVNGDDGKVIFTLWYGDIAVKIFYEGIVCDNF